MGVAITLVGCGGEVPQNLETTVPPAAVALTTVRTRPLPLLVPQRVSLGTVLCGGSSRRQVTVTNSTNDPLQVAAVQSTCPCVRVDPGSFEIGPGEQRTLVVVADMADESHYTGSLGVELELLAPGGRTLARFKVTFDVTPSEENPP